MCCGVFVFGFSLFRTSPRVYSFIPHHKGVISPSEASVDNKPRKCMNFFLKTIAEVYFFAFRPQKIYVNATFPAANSPKIGV